MGNLNRAEACLNNATEHFVKLGNVHGEAGALRLLAKLYRDRKDDISAIRCLERVVQIDLTYRYPQYEEDRQQLIQLRGF